MTPGSSMDTVNLLDHQAWIPTVAAWIYGEWHDIITHPSLEAYTTRLRTRVKSAGIPITFVGTRDGRPVGTASLVARDLAIRPELTPWLAAVFVPPEHRNEGAGTALVSHATQYAFSLCVGRLYLYTFNREGFYARQGWAVLERTSCFGRDITIMTRDAGEATDADTSSD